MSVEKCGSGYHRLVEQGKKVKFSKKGGFDEVKIKETVVALTIKTQISIQTRGML